MNIKPTQPGQAALPECCWDEPVPVALVPHIHPDNGARYDPASRKTQSLPSETIFRILSKVGPSADCDLCLQPRGRFLSLQRTMMLSLHALPNLGMVKALLYSDVMFILCSSSRIRYTIFELTRQ